MSVFIPMRRNSINPKGIKLTNDELLAKIGRYSKGASRVDSHAWKIVDKIMELHSIDEIKNCVYCEVAYPCRIVEFIEKELE